MSEKKETKKRHSVKVPLYKLDICLEEVEKIGEDVGFKSQFLTALILGDWLTTFMLRSREAPKGSDEALLSFCATCEKHFTEYQKVLLDAQEK